MDGCPLTEASTLVVMKLAESSDIEILMRSVDYR
jgi:hypothetical protein